METSILNKFEEFIKRELFSPTSFHPHFNAAYKKMFEAGGKRFRPLLLLSVVKSINPLLLNQAMHAALALEMIHTYSLIHDDLPSMDNSELRRGEPTLHVTYNETTAILVGDALNTDAFLMIADMSIDDKTKVELIKTLSFNAGSFGMVLGQAIDCEFENIKLNESELSNLHINKTGKLIASALKMGAIVVNLDKATTDRLYEFGLDLGLLFQINDDIIDATQSSFEAGKTTNSDTNKNSYVNLHGLKKAEELKANMIIKLNDALLSFENIALREELKNILMNNIK